MDKPAKRKPGRPTKYKGTETLGQVYAVINRIRHTPQDFLQLCGMEQLADALEVSRDTLYVWAKEHPEFSDALKSWLTARNACLYRLAKTLPPAIWIFMAKNWLGMRDKQTIELPGMEQALRFEFGSPLPPPENKLIIEYVDTKGDPIESPGPGHAPPPSQAEGRVAIMRMSRPGPPSKAAAELSDAELEAEIARLEREQEKA